MGRDAGNEFPAVHLHPIGIAFSFLILGEDGLSRPLVFCVTTMSTLPRRSALSDIRPGSPMDSL
jgi:hypothetical protein